MIGLCDCNNFFASCERVFRPDLDGKPVVVLSNNDGCIIARSNEAKALGIKMGTPLFQARDVIEQNNVSVFSSNYQLYGDMSNRVISILKETVPAIEVYSIDEAFLNLEGLPLDGLQQKGRDLSARIKKDTGIPVSIGIAPTKTLAKIASKLCKQYPKLRGCCLMYRPQDIEKVLRKFPVGDVWGIGRKYRRKLQLMGVSSAWDFCSLPRAEVSRLMSVTGVKTWMELHGEPCIGFDEVPQDRQTICVSRSFAHDMTDLGQLDAAVATFTSKVAEKLRARKLKASVIHVFILTNRHRDEKPQDYSIRTTGFEVATNSTIELTEAASEALKYIYKKGFGYKRAGVMVTDLVDSDKVQGVFFDTVDHEKQDRLMKVIDSINSVSGRSTVRIASNGEMDDFSTRSRVSKRYTTRWDELMEVVV
ncbi:MAG: Y-family DNA polymerase [Bacteroidales bacterium]|nr:Y-family DNA polymerase [Bacteroidales bacterium]